MTEIYTFNFPTKIRFGKGVIEELGPHLAEAGIKRPLLVSDATCTKLPFFKKIEQNLKKNHLKYFVFDEIHKNPIKSDVEKGTTVLHQNKCDAIVGIGGGASLDVARAIALKANHSRDLFDFEDSKNGAALVVGEIPYFVAIPTTSGTGSEVGRSTVISDDETKQKKILFSPKLMAKIVFADPELTLDLPPQITAATGMDALTHHIEAYLAKGYHPMCDGIALEGIRLTFQHLPKAFEKGDYESRSGMMMAALMGAVAFQKGLGVVHSLAHPLSTVYDIHHGLANAVMLPYGLAYNYPMCEVKFKQMSQAIGSKDFIQSIKELGAKLKIPSKLSSIGVDEKNLKALIKLAVADPCHSCNPVPVTEKDFITLYTKAL